MSFNALEAIEFKKSIEDAKEEKHQKYIDKYKSRLIKCRPYIIKQVTRQVKDSIKKGDLYTTIDTRKIYTIRVVRKGGFFAKILHCTLGLIMPLSILELGREVDPQLRSNAINYIKNYLMDHGYERIRHSDHIIVYKVPRVNQ